jgi:succinoglycan biosynthesis protein ExoA
MISVSVIIPCRNEVDFIANCLESILNQDFPKEELEILVIDGFSDDGTRRILEDYQEKYFFIRLIDNINKIVSPALNIGIKNAKGEIIIRMDVHTEYASDYITQCVRAIRGMAVENVGGPWIPKGKTYLQKGISIAFQSHFSSGGALSHDMFHEGLVDSVYLGCWKKSTLENIGLFDEELVRNQDDELNLRIIRSGGKIWQSPKISSWYYPRSSIVSVFKQYMQYGYWKVRVIQKHRIPASIRHVIPGVAIILFMTLFVLSFFNLIFLKGLVGLVLAYWGINFVASFLTCKEFPKWKFFPVIPIIFLMYHAGYGYGFLRGTLDFAILKKHASKTFTNLTRGAKCETKTIVE